MFLSRIAIVLILLMSGFSGALAEEETLTEDQAKRFIASLYDLDKMKERLEAVGHEALKIETEPKPGEAFKPYSQLIVLTKDKFPTVHGELTALIKSHKFKTAEWGTVGDRIFVASMAVQIDEESPGAFDHIKSIDKSVLASLPEAQRAPMLRVLLIAETIENVPAADKEVAKRVQPEFTAYMAQAQ